MKMVTPPNFANLTLCCAANNAEMQILYRTMKKLMRTAVKTTNIHLHAFKKFNGSIRNKLISLILPSRIAQARQYRVHQKTCDWRTESSNFGLLDVAREIEIYNTEPHDKLISWRISRSSYPR